jgi:hypothetical protein
MAKHWQTLKSCLGLAIKDIGWANKELVLHRPSESIETVPNQGPARPIRLDPLARDMLLPSPA